MNSVFKLTFIALALLMSLNTYAQLSLGGQASYLKLFGGTEISNIGFGINGEYATSIKTSIRGGVNYYLSHRDKYTSSAYALASFTDPNSVSVDVENRISFLQVYFGGKRYLIGDYEENFGFYGIAEGGLLIAVAQVAVGSYDRSLYDTSVRDGEKETIIGFTINLGIGAETELNFGYLFGDLKLNWPANQAGGVAVPVDIPVSVSVNIGVRVPF